MRFSFEYPASSDSTVKRVLARGGVSHRLFSRLKAAGLIWVDGHRAGNVEVRAGQIVRFELPSDEGVTPSAGAIEVVRDVGNWLLVNKPAGLTSVPGPHNPADSLLNRAAGYLQRQGYDSPHPAIITRLDRDTSGLVLIAKHGFAQGLLDQNQAAAQLDKRYYALAGGVMTERWGRVVLPLGAGADGIHQVVRADGKDARTDYRVLQAGTHAALLECHLLTGRTHQIRVHMAQCGHPLLGDALYGGNLQQLQTQALMASQLSFTDPFTGERISAELPLPAAWQELL
ncbi:RluA family pseudouridine synthase [Lacticaseibacillus songhuajiangensis]|uniref:RluA family pseudouridine synthase n=1 Tax=Lacticaseibacillus songhuajiangensis TaxID=1296539 RepID=UPI000F78EAD2|nr:RluA family pseudouridine synthase [Lacticaseibacillus songhuajiangensis]